MSSQDDPPAAAPADFTSIHDFERSDMAWRLGRIRWFARCGQSAELHLTMPVERVAGWEQAAAACADPAWEAARAGAAQQLAVWLQRNDPGSYGKWSELAARQTQGVIDPLTAGVLAPFQEQHGLDPALVRSVRRDLLGALMENAYLGSGHRSCFFLELLWVYEAGHFPCGWRGAWPDGTLLVY
jgi:hypothetical protein